MKTVYILMHIISEDLNQMVGLVKKKGFSYLVNKLTVPGGKAEAGETIFEAASRETMEECGLSIPSTDWKLFDTVEKEEYSYHKVYAFSKNVALAKQMEIEPVFVMDVEKHRKECQTNPSIYTPDFSENMEKLFLAIQENKTALYPEYFFTAKYYMDNVTDSNPHIFEMNIYASTGLKIKDYGITTNGEISPENNIISSIRVYIAFEDNEKRSPKLNWSFYTIDTPHDFNEFVKEKEKSHNFRNGLIVSEKVNEPSRDFHQMFKNISKQVLKSISSTENLKSYIKEKYKRDVSKIIERMKKIDELLASKINDLEKEGKTCLDLSKVNPNRLLFNFSSPETIRKVKLHTSLNNHLNEKSVSGQKNKI